MSDRAEISMGASFLMATLHGHKILPTLGFFCTSENLSISAEKMAGAEGFEPSDGRVRVYRLNHLSTPQQNLWTKLI